MQYIFFGHENAFQSLISFDKFSVKLIMKLLGAKIGENCVIESGIRFHNCKNLRNLEIGDNCYIGKNCFFDLRGRIKIKNNVVISMKNTFITHIDMAKSELNKKYPATTKNISVGNNAYIGSDCCILKGVVIGRNSIVAAKSLVNKNLESYSLYAGIPVKKIKSIE
tara:strand:+ start:8596 stop:9093 length:498 start_codon:yes stop_codon:yes gene_type:complete